MEIKHKSYFFASSFNSGVRIIVPSSRMISQQSPHSFKPARRIKSTLALFDDSGSLWDLFCENTTILINDPNKPTGYTDFNTEALNGFLRLMNTSKITLFLDEAYADSVKVTDSNMPKWRTISRYIINNINAQGNIRAVSSLSTTKNLSATGDRLGALAVNQRAQWGAAVVGCGSSRARRDTQ